MSRYDPLRDYLQSQRASFITLSFRDIEDLIGGPLPASAMRPQWWANVKDPNTTHVQRHAWGNAGYDAFLIGGQQKVRFQRLRLT